MGVNTPKSRDILCHNLESKRRCKRYMRKEDRNVGKPWALTRIWYTGRNSYRRISVKKSKDDLGRMVKSCIDVEKQMKTKENLRMPGSNTTKDPWEWPLMEEASVPLQVPLLQGRIPAKAGLSFLRVKIAMVQAFNLSAEARYK